MNTTTLFTPVSLFLIVSLIGCGEPEHNKVNNDQPTEDMSTDDLSRDMSDMSQDMSNKDMPDKDMPDSSDMSDMSEDAPWISDALSCGKKGAAGGVRQGDQMQRHTLSLDDYPDAACNDGSPGAFYYRPYRGEENKNRWVIQLKGGGACRDAESCISRWCSRGSNFGMDLMTTTMSPMTKDAAGILDASRDDNPWRGFNHVFVYYCSSDSWTGTREAVLTGEDPVSGDPITFKVKFGGHAIIDAVVSMLKTKPETLTYTLNGQNTTMPDLDDAQYVVLAGASAGGSGVAQNLDRLSGQLGQTVHGLVDSSFPPSYAEYDITQSPLCLMGGECDGDLFAKSQLISSTATRGNLFDESCLAHFMTTNPDEIWRCGDKTYVMENHLTTPFFVRMGLVDSQSSGTPISGNFKTKDGDPVTIDVFRDLTRSKLEALANLTQTAVEANAIQQAPGVFGPSCPKHETLQSTPDTFRVQVDVNGQPYRFFDVFNQWRMMQSPGVVVEQGTQSTCP